MKTKTKKAATFLADAEYNIKYYRPESRYLFIKEYIQYHGATILLVNHKPEANIVKPEPTTTNENMILSCLREECYGWGETNRVRLITKNGKETYLSNRNMIDESYYHFPVNKIRTTGCFSRLSLEATVMAMHEYDILNKHRIFGLIPVKNRKNIDLSEFDILI